MIQDHSKDPYQEGIQNVVKSVILYSTTFRGIATDLADLYEGDKIQPYDYATLFKNFYERTNQLIEAVSTTMAELIRRDTMLDSVRSKTTNSLRKEIVEDSFHELNENLQSFRSYVIELGISIDSKTQENQFLTATLTAGAITALLSGTRKVSFVDGMAMAAVINRTGNNSQQINQMRSDKVNMALAAMITTTSLLQNLVTRLMDQYCSLVYGGQIDLHTRDKYLTQGNIEINLISDKCNHIAYGARDIYDLALQIHVSIADDEAMKSKRNIGYTWLALAGIFIIAGIIDSKLSLVLGLIFFTVGIVKLSGTTSFSTPTSQTQETPIQIINKMATEMRFYATQLEQIANRYMGVNSYL